MSEKMKYKYGCYVGQLNDSDQDKIINALSNAGLSYSDIEMAVCSRVSDLDCTIDIMSVIG